MLQVLASAFLALLGIAALRGARGARGWRVPATVACGLIATLSIAYLSSNYFTGRGIDESTIYHLRFGLRGAGFGEYSGLAFAMTGLFALSLLGAIFVFRVLSIPSGRTWRAAEFTGGSLLIVALGWNPAVQDLFGLYGSDFSHQPTRSRIALEGFNKAISLNTVEAPKNIVVLYLEGLEHTYFDERRFPGLVPGLKSLEKEGTTFTGIEQVWGTGWTIAGMTASQCGIPLVTSKMGGNSMSGLDEFLPGAVCMGDLLKEQGYQLTFIGGAKLDFAGKGQFYRSHGFDTVFGLEELKTELEDPEYQSWWGLYDDSLFSIANQYVDETQEGPFGLFLLSLDTHHPSGHVSKSCMGHSYGDGSNPILNAVHCTDRLATEFVKGLRLGRHAEDTVVVLLSDHLAMRNTATDLLEDGDGSRRNFFIVLSPTPGAPQVVDRRASTLDIAPTVLSFLGYDMEALGFGRNLVGDQATIVEEYPDPNAVLRRYRDRLSEFWEFPKLDHGLFVSIEERSVHFGKRVTEFPVLFVMDDSENVVEVAFPNELQRKLIAYVGRLKAGTPLMWVDRCDHVSALTTGSWLDDAEMLCLGVGRLGARSYLSQVIDGLLFHTRAELIDRLRPGQSVDPSLIDRLHRVREFGRPEISEVVISAAGYLTGDVIVRSAPYGRGDSFLESLSDGSRLTGFKRGLTLVGVGSDSKPTKIGHIDTCEIGNPLLDLHPLKESVNQAVQRFGGFEGKFGAYLVIGHDSVWCRKSLADFNLFGELPLTAWEDLGFREPYVAVIAGDGTVYEQAGKRERDLTIRLRNFVAIPNP